LQILGRDEDLSVPSDFILHPRPELTAPPFFPFFPPSLLSPPPPLPPSSPLCFSPQLNPDPLLFALQRSLREMYEADVELAEENAWTVSKG